MTKLLSICFLVLTSIATYAQVSTAPAFPKADQPITFTVDVSGTALEGYNSEVWIWTWISTGCATGCDAPTNVNPAGSAQSAALMTRSATDANIYSITFTPTSFFGKEADAIKEIGLLLKGKDWSNGKTPDYKVEISSGGLALLFSAPAVNPLFLNSGESMNIEVIASDIADLSLTIDGDNVGTATADKISYNYTAGSPGKYAIKIVGSTATEMVSKEIYVIVRSATEVSVRPEGVIAGINYSPDVTKATLCLWAPNKGSVYVISELSGWEVDPNYQMKKDGEYFWIELSGLTANKEYPFQYLVDEEIYIAEPFADKILDPNDQYIPSSTYPNLLTYPEEAVRDEWYFNRLSVLETGRSEYEWQTTNYAMPEQSELVIYELLIRDFFDQGQQNYQNLIDTLSYLSDLGVNAIELMPIMEFNGNESWGYNPAFMFAPDKYYGTREKFKEFVDAAHGKGIAVILDIAMNHNDIPAPFALMYFDFDKMTPTVDNPWFNTGATHPFNVFFDFDHESQYTQQFLDTINHYWLNEYKIDGYRFDLSKGFTQKYSGNDVGAWSSYDASRVSLLKRMADEIWSHSPDAYVILEHFADNTEEKELADYGMMLWGNLNHNYNQLAMGYASSSNIDWGYYKTRDWTKPNLITYMESHDEERMVYKTTQSGNSAGSYNIKDTNTGLQRAAAAAAFFYTIPGPKMLWQFGEVGYDFSINTCTDGSISGDCRLAIKPVPWNNVDGLAYNEDEARNKLKGTVSEIIKLASTYSIFSAQDVTIMEDGLIRQLALKNEPYLENPVDTDDMNVYIVGNFDVTTKNVTAKFPHTGRWYNYFAPDNTLNITSASPTIEIKPGQFMIFTDVQLPSPPDYLIEQTITGFDPGKMEGRQIYPNPVRDMLYIDNHTSYDKAVITDIKGKTISTQKYDGSKAGIDVGQLEAGIYIIQLHSADTHSSYRFIKTNH